MDSLGRKIARAREKMDWTQDELALRSRVPRRTIQNIEYDRVSPRLDNLLAMARTLKY
jgi:transcriptional regulator with XRE-family HTH domain